MKVEENDCGDCSSSAEYQMNDENDNGNKTQHDDNNKIDQNSYQEDDRTLYHLPPLPSSESFNTEKHDYDLDSIVEKLETDGVVVLPSVFSQEQIEAFRRAHEENFQTVRNLVSETEAYQKPYRHDFDKKRYCLMPHYEIQHEDTGEWHEVIEISPGRLDYTFGMNPVSDDESDSSSDSDDSIQSDEDDGKDSNYPNIFASTEFQRPKILADLMDRMLKADYQSYAGALPSAGKSRDGPWHRDTYLLFDDETVDINLPYPYYFTVLIPLVTVDADNGATEFLLGSHRQTCQEALRSTPFQACAEPGSIIVFDGRICHRGRRNLTDANRTVLYMVWTKLWYNDY